jgi:hypothetical protein
VTVRRGRAGRVGIALSSGMLAFALAVATTGCNVEALDDLVRELEGLADDKLAGDDGAGIGGYGAVDEIVSTQLLYETIHGVSPWGGDEARLQNWCSAWADTFQGPLGQDMIKGAYRTEDSPVLPDHQQDHYDKVLEAHQEAFRSVPQDHYVYAIMAHLIALMEESVQGWASLLGSTYDWSYEAALNDGATMRYYTIEHMGNLSTWGTPVQMFAERWCLADPSSRGPDGDVEPAEWDEAWDDWGLDEWLEHFQLSSD